MNTPLHIVLVEPEIPANTGNIARTCVATGTALHVIRPLGFSLDDRYMKRAGLDYWDALDMHVHDAFDDYVSKHPHMTMWMLTTKAHRVYTEGSYTAPTALVFGKETAGLPIALLEAHADRCMRLPMVSAMRSLNLANAVAITTYEVLRQRRFPGLV
jgi:tRNA (cytidine/uridine-2'-O-)-methyltransferase